MNMNNQVFFFFYNFAYQSNFLDHIVIFFGVWFPYLVIILAGLFLLFHHEVLGAESPVVVFWEKKKEILSVFVTGAFAWIIAQVLKYVIQSPRPFDIFSQVHSVFPETGYGFPSGHATFFMALAFSIFFLHKKAGYFFIFFALIIGVARIIAGVHFPLDILGGFVLGAIVATLVKYLKVSK